MHSSSRKKIRIFFIEFSGSGFTNSIEGDSCKKHDILYPLELDLKKFKHDDIVELQKNHPLFTEKLVCTCDDPYKKGRNGFMSKDILEVFIEKKNLGRIR